MLFHIIHILLLTLDPNPNPKLKKKHLCARNKCGANEAGFLERLKGGWAGLVHYLFDCW